MVVFTVALTGLGRRGLRRARGQAGPDRGEAPRARAARQGDSGRDSREARSQEGVISGLAATDLRTLLHHVCARHPNGKLRPIIRSRNGMHFPNESKTGKCIPQSALKVGRRFPMRLKRKMHPGICAQSGMRFPVEGLRGKFVPESTLEMGCSFPMRHSTENTSQKWPLSWDKISAASRILKNETRRWRK